MALGARGLPVFVVAEHIPNPNDLCFGYHLTHRALWCEDARCGS